tara:strand:+ start:66 stop:791 length:726 start_codon:yes stop_codon:yes gene_type:complete
MPWQPPDNPDPHVILHEASDDTRSERFNVALTKFLWFHENAVEIQPSFSGVRRSFALAYWMELAELHQPAMDAFLATRDRTEERFRLDYASYDLFADVSSMNQRIGDEQRTANLFCAAASKSPERATRYYHVAEESLVACGRYRECAPFLECDDRFRHAVRVYRMSLERESKPRQGRPRPKTALKLFTDDVATLIALLSLNDMMTSAESVRDRASQIVTSHDFLDTINSAVAGHFPPPRRG